MHADGVCSCCVLIHALYNYNTQQSSKHVHGVGGECDEVQEGRIQLPLSTSLLQIGCKTNMNKRNYNKMNGHRNEELCKYTHTHTRTHTLRSLVHADK